MPHVLLATSCEDKAGVGAILCLQSVVSVQASASVASRSILTGDGHSDLRTFSNLLEVEEEGHCRLCRDGCMIVPGIYRLNWWMVTMYRMIRSIGVGTMYEHCFMRACL